VVKGDLRAAATTRSRTRIYVERNMCSGDRAGAPHMRPTEDRRLRDGSVRCSTGVDDETGWPAGQLWPTSTDDRTAFLSMLPSCGRALPKSLPSLRTSPTAKISWPSSGRHEITAEGCGPFVAPRNSRDRRHDDDDGHDPQSHHDNDDGHNSNRRGWRTAPLLRQLQRRAAGRRGADAPSASQATAHTLTATMTASPVRRRHPRPAYAHQNEGASHVPTRWCCRSGACPRGRLRRFASLRRGGSRYGSR